MSTVGSRQSCRLLGPVCRDCGIVASMKMVRAWSPPCSVSMNFLQATVSGRTTSFSRRVCAAMADNALEADAARALLASAVSFAARSFFSSPGIPFEASNAPVTSVTEGPPRVARVTSVSSVGVASTTAGFACNSMKVLARGFNMSLTRVDMPRESSPDGRATARLATSLSYASRQSSVESCGEVWPAQSWPELVFHDALNDREQATATRPLTTALKQRCVGVLPTEIKEVLHGHMHHGLAFQI